MTKKEDRRKRNSLIRSVVISDVENQFGELGDGVFVEGNVVEHCNYTRTCRIDTIESELSL